MALTGDQSREISRLLIDKYFLTVPYPYTRHHIDSYDQFLQQDLINIIQSNNPILILKDHIKDNKYKYKVEIFVGGEDGNQIEIGTPTLSLQNTDEVRILYPNEARLRNLTYSSTVYANIIVKIEYRTPTDEIVYLSPPAETFQKWPLFKIPIMLHSRYCILNNKPKEFLREVGECPYDNGGYFIVDGSEKILITRQEQSFNTLYISPQNDPKVEIYASIECLSAKTRQIKRISFSLMRYVEKSTSHNQHIEEKKAVTSLSQHATIQVSLPFVRKPIPLFVLFRALGFQSDEEIIKLIFPDFESSEAKVLLSKLHPSIVDAFPFLNSYTSVQYIKTLTKGFSIAHVLNIIKNQLFIHMPNDSHSQALFLGDCVRKILRVSEGYDQKTDRDDTRNQRCLTSGFLIQELFNNSYKLWIKASALSIDKEYNYNKNNLYKDENFKNIFQASNDSKIFMGGFLNDMIMKGFKGKWGTGLGEDKSGVLQALSRLSYTDFMSHCRRVILDFDTSMKLTGPRKLHTSQYGYFCTSETPTGGSIGIAKNLSIMTAISTTSQTATFFKWLKTTGNVYENENVTEQQRILFVPVYVNGGAFGYTSKPYLLTKVLKLLKRSGCLPYSTSITFSIRDRKVYIYMDAGRPLRPLIWIEKMNVPYKKLKEYPTWRYLVMGTLKVRESANLESTDFFDPLDGKLENYPDMLLPHTGAIEYIDPYEQNESFIANNAVYITAETTHMEVHPSTIMSMMTSLIPFAPHNQSPRNQLSCSQSKQGISIYATNWKNRFDNTAHVLCYGEMPLTRTIYNNYLGEGKMAYGMNCILAIACWTGYNQEDGIVMNGDAVKRGMFRTMAYRSYEAYEKNDEKANVQVRIANPSQIGKWNELRPGFDYSKLDNDGIIKEGEYVDETTVIVGAYMMNTLDGSMKDASTTPQVWTRGRVEKVVTMINNVGLKLVKIRVTQDRIPELGDKFCLTDDHEVLTENGWINIKHINKTHSVLQRNAETGKGEWVHPTENFNFYNDDILYDFSSKNRKIVVTKEHRLWTDKGFIKAHEAYESENIIMGDETTMETFTSKCIYNSECNVYCISVPSEVFLVRHIGKEPLWTGNSNRHGQKGTIGALLRGHDMPRTASGIVPDMIMNPHAIPSRMTIAQNLEQLLGKAAALSGAIGDGTAFMNDGSPEGEIGAILDKLGFEKYGNEIMYNGATGEQIKAVIFIGPVYGMRLKHMVEDKWQARGIGRKEIRTHQPTGGRGAQGGLKIGEMDRDAIIAHGGMSFVRESFMDRSDGAKIPICVACGTFPIYNPKLDIAMCSLCDGPVRYLGDNVSNLEILPPLGRPKSKIVEVEMPYSMKLLTQEQETYLNISMRYITTSGVTRLNELEFSGNSSEIVKELPRLILPDIVAPAYIEEVPKELLTAEQRRSMAASIMALTEEEKQANDIIIEPTLDVVQMPFQGEINPDQNGIIPGIVSELKSQPIISGIMSQVQDISEQVQEQVPQFIQNQFPQQNQQQNQQVQQNQQNQQQNQVQQVPLQNQQQNQVQQNQQVPLQNQQQNQEQLEGEGLIRGGFVPGSGPMIAVRTDRDAMMHEGLIGGFRPRQIRRNQTESPQKYNSDTVISVTKLE